MFNTATFAQRMSRLGTESAFEVLSKAKALEAQGQNIVHLKSAAGFFRAGNISRKALIRRSRTALPSIPIRRASGKYGKPWLSIAGAISGWM